MNNSIGAYLKKHYQLINYNDLCEFIDKHTNFVNFLKEVTPLIEKQFPNNEKSIELLYDPEIENYEHVSINIIIPQDNPISEIEESDILDVTLDPLVRKYDVFNNFITWVLYDTL